MKRIPHLIVLLVFSSVTFAQAEIKIRAQNVLAQINGTIKTPGLQRPVNVLRDEWGIAHIYAETQDDLFFAQGFVAAQDRLWQLDIWRRTGVGEPPPSSWSRD